MTLANMNIFYKSHAGTLWSLLQQPSHTWSQPQWGKTQPFQHTLGFSEDSIQAQESPLLPCLEAQLMQLGGGEPPEDSFPGVPELMMVAVAGSCRSSPCWVLGRGFFGEMCLTPKQVAKFQGGKRVRARGKVRDT